MPYASLNLGDFTSVVAGADVTVAGQQLNGGMIYLYGNLAPHNGTLKIQISLDGATWIDYIDDDGGVLQITGADALKARPVAGSAVKIRANCTAFTAGVLSARFATLRKQRS